MDPVSALRYFPDVSSRFTYADLHHLPSFQLPVHCVCVCMFEDTHVCELAYGGQGTTSVVLWVLFTSVLLFLLSSFLLLSSSSLASSSLLFFF